MKNTNDCIACERDICTVKHVYSGAALAEFSKKKTQSWYKKGEFIVREGDPIHGIFFLQEGKTKIFSSSISGAQQIVRLCSSGESLCFRGYGRKNYISSVMALEDSFVCFFSNEDLMPIFSTPELSMMLIKYLGDELEVAERRLKYLMQMNVREKVAEALLFMKKSFGVNEKNELNVYMSREDIAAIAGTSQELVIRQLSEFEKDKYIDRREHKNIALLNEKVLQDMVSKYHVFT